MSSASFASGAVNQPCELLCGTNLPNKGTSFTSLGAENGGGDDVSQLVPRAGRLGIEEVPFSGYEPVPNTFVPPVPSGWGDQVDKESALRKFENRNTQGLDGGGRSTNITRFTPQLIQFQQDDDMARVTLFERNNAPRQKKDFARV